MSSWKHGTSVCHGDIMVISTERNWFLPFFWSHWLSYTAHNYLNNINNNHNVVITIIIVILSKKLMEYGVSTKIQTVQG